MNITAIKNINIEGEENGVYHLSPFSGVGKSYMAKILKDLGDFGKPYTSVTYKDKIRSAEYYKKYKLVFFDRVDLYYSKKLEELFVELGKSTIVLFDMKNVDIVGDIYHFAYLELKEDFFKLVLI